MLIVDNTRKAYYHYGIKVLLYWYTLMSTLSLKLPDALSREIEIASKKRGISKSMLVKKAIAQYLHSNKNSTALQGSFLELAADFCGIFKGPKDLSTNKEHLEGFGEE